ncbi:hypothetical protein E4U55_006058 [Claviceps digitariae]|nr:hypothetical protein E4U55_006058 [Claviceps digitariae]
MTSILTSIFSSRKPAMDRGVASSPLGPKSTISTKQSKRKSLPEKKARRSVKSLDNCNNAPSPTLSRSQSQFAKTSSAAKASARAPSKAPARSPAQLPAKAPVTPLGQSLAKVSLDQNDAVQESVEQHVSDGQSARTETETNEAATSVDEAEDQYTFDKFVNYRWVGNSIEILVEWQDGDLTWEQEAALHEDALDALLAYWESQGGRPTNTHDPDLFDIHAIRKHSKDRKKLLVEWVGYDPKEASWVPRAAVEETAPEVVAGYWRSIRDAGPGKRKGRRG